MVFMGVGIFFTYINVYMCTRVSVIASETFKRLHDRAIEVGKKQRTIVGDDVYEITTNDKNTCMLFIFFYNHLVHRCLCCCGRHHRRRHCCCCHRPYRYRCLSSYFNNNKQIKFVTIAINEEMERAHAANIIITNSLYVK